MALYRRKKGVAEVIPVTQQPEPTNFDTEVRQRGITELRRRRLDPEAPLSQGTDLEPFWRKGHGYPGCLDELFKVYMQTCSYLAVRIERVMCKGVLLSASVDHFIPYSTTQSRLAYEWSNYRLAAAVINSRKQHHCDVIDPFEVQNGWFTLNLETGFIIPDSMQPPDIRGRVQSTIARLRLNADEYCVLRENYFKQYEDHRSHDRDFAENFLRRNAPFVWQEIRRQNRL